MSTKNDQLCDLQTPLLAKMINIELLLKQKILQTRFKTAPNPLSPTVFDVDIINVLCLSYVFPEIYIFFLF